MKLPSGRMCSGPVMVEGKLTFTVYPATNKAEVISIVEEWLGNAAASRIPADKIAQMDVLFQKLEDGP